MVVSDVNPECGVGQRLNHGSLQLDHVAFCQASYLLHLTEPIPEGGQRPPDVTVQHRLAVLQAAGNRVRPDPRGNNVLSPFFFGSLKFSAFSVHQPEKVALLPEDQKEVSSVMAGNGPYHVSSQKRHRRRSPTWVRISGSPFVMRIEFS